MQRVPEENFTIFLKIFDSYSNNYEVTDLLECMRSEILKIHYTKLSLQLWRLMLLLIIFEWKRIFLSNARQYLRSIVTLVCCLLKFFNFGILCKTENTQLKILLTRLSDKMQWNCNHIDSIVHRNCEPILLSFARHKLPGQKTFCDPRKKPF